MAYYTLIAYKPDASDYCRGCHMASYSSNFEMAHGARLADLSAFWKRIQHTDLKSERGDSAHELTLLINGIPRDELGFKDPAMEALVEESRAWERQLEAEVRAEFAAEKEHEAAEKAAAEQRAALARETREREEYLRLRARFEGDQHA